MLKISVLFIIQVFLGVLNKDELIIVGMIGILEDYIKYVLRIRDEVFFFLVFFCDGFNCERVEGVQRGEDSWDRLDMFEFVL